MMKQRATLKVIAKELDVSVSTVSKALRDSKEIGKDTKEKVKAFAKLYNYRPNNIALSLKNKKTKTLGVIIPEIVHHFFTTVIYGIEEYANTKGYNVIVGLSNESFELSLQNTNAAIVHQLTFDYDDQYSSKKSGGYSLELVDLTQPCLSDSWKYSESPLGGSLGKVAPQTPDKLKTKLNHYPFRKTSSW